MTDNSVPVVINILDKEYRIACPAEEQESLRVSAEQLNKRMNEIKNSGKVIGSDRIAVMAALNITHDLLNEQKQHEGFDKTLTNRLKLLQERIDGALSEHQQLNL